MKQVKKRVESLMENDIATRNSDIELYIQYFEKYVCTNVFERYTIRSLFLREWTNVAWIVRARARIQNKDWKYLSHKQVQAFRDAKEVEMTQEFSDINNNKRY